MGGPRQLPMRMRWAARVAQFCRSARKSAPLRRLPALQLFQHPGFEELFEQGQDAAVHDPLPNQLHQSVVRNRIEGTYDTLPTSTTSRTRSG